MSFNLNSQMQNSCRSCGLVCHQDIPGTCFSITLTHIRMQLHSGVKSHPALSTGVSGPRLNMCHRVRHRDDRVSITTPRHHFHPQCFSGLQLSQVLWLIAPAIKYPGKGTEAVFLQEKLLTKESFLRGTMSHSYPPPPHIAHHLKMNPDFESVASLPPLTKHQTAVRRPGFLRKIVSVPLGSPVSTCVLCLWLHI